MSAVRAVWIECDSCHDDDPGISGNSNAPEYYDVAQFPLDLNCRTAAEARDGAKARGWHRHGRRDICRECWEAGHR